MPQMIIDILRIPNVHFFYIPLFPREGPLNWNSYNYIKIISKKLSRARDFDLANAVF